ncbi:HAD family hydrolase [Sphingomonas sp. PAMC 26605]|uniref:HAD family hydrolase n=1 Tax=Sphingomonas sp. PAMC 26605 TaxID=1112214 RepID=UPI00026CA74C|nr:HAD-IB family phosphatase [Sphingomonas sp. PAMC 26605]
MHHIAVYDMDKTITYAPTWTSFLVQTAKREAPWRLALLPVAALATLGYAARLIGRARLKEITQRLLLGPTLPEPVAARAAARFAERVVATGVYAGALAQIAEDRAAGNRLVLATASYGFYAAAIAARLGFDTVIATDVERDHGVIHARIRGENCYGPAKRAMLEAWLAGERIARSDATIRFYSDHVSDMPSLEWADVAIAANPHTQLRARAWERGWWVVDWTR